MFVSMYVSMYVCMYVCMYIRVCVCVCVCVCVLSACVYVGLRSLSCMYVRMWCLGFRLGFRLVFRTFRPAATCLGFRV